MIDLTEQLKQAIEEGWSQEEFEQAASKLATRLDADLDLPPQGHWAQIETNNAYYGLVLRDGPLFLVRPSVIEIVQEEFPSAQVVELAGFFEPEYTVDEDVARSLFPGEPMKIDFAGGLSGEDLWFELS